MDKPRIDSEYVRSAAAAVGLELPPERLSAVLENLQRIAAIAAPALEADVAPEDEAAPVWRP